MIHLERIQHREQDRILLKPAERMEKSDFNAYAEKIKQVAGVAYSKTHQGYHVPYTRSSFTRLLEIFGKDYIVYDQNAPKQPTERLGVAEQKKELPIQPTLEKKAVVKTDTTTATGIRLEHYEKYYRLYMPKNDADVQFVLGIRYSQWNKEGYYWRIPRYGDNVERIRKYFGNRLQENMDNLPARKTPEMPPPGVCRCVQMQNGRVSFLANYHAELVKFLKCQPYPAYNQDTRLWTVAWHENLIQEITLFTLRHGLTLQWENASGKRIGEPRPLYKKMKDYRAVPNAYLLKLKQINYDKNTINNYCMHFEEFLNRHNPLNLEDINPEMIEKHMQYLVTERNLGVSSQKGAISAIKFYYEKVLKKQKYTYLFEQPREEKKLPKVLSKQEIKAIIAKANNLKHSFFLKLTYGTGLRVQELIDLEWSDINTDRKMILVRDAKYNKDRYIPLPKKVLELIPTYRAQYGLIKYVVEPESGPGKAYSARSAQNVFSDCLKRAGIEKPATFHTLRHCFATHALENGVSLRVIHQLPGHSSLKTTEIYRHITQKTKDECRSPLDELDD